MLGYRQRPADPTLESAWHLWRAGQWELALAACGHAAGSVAVLRAEILVDRHGWQLDPPDEALQAVRDIDADEPVLGRYLTGVLAYWRQIFQSDAERTQADLATTFEGVSADSRLAGWATFQRSVVFQYLSRDLKAASAGFALTLDLARAGGDLMLESYALRHQAELALDHDRDRAVGLARRSLNLRTALGARPQCAAAQAQLAQALGSGREADELRFLSARTAGELRLAWLLPEGGPDGARSGA
jgi:hypothetical protein